ncbi:Gamma-glutamyltranspeptidase [Dactylellina cionopaga]|nr:Gamma-glutamyltranspeptidase [Dactylellina cionopaga]
MNNEMNDFSIPGVRNVFGYVPSAINYVAPGKRPLSSMSPTIVEFIRNGTLYYVTGGAGGSRIITAVLQTLLHVLDRGMDVAQALKQPRYHDQLDPNEVAYEFDFDNATVHFMEKKGHKTSFEARDSEVQALRRLPNGTFEAASEPMQRFSGGFAI